MYEYTSNGADCFRRPRDTLRLAPPLKLNPVAMAPGGRSEDLAPKEQSVESPGIELDHAIGYSIISAGLCYHPNGTHMVYAAGGTVVICDFNDPHTQQILTGHDRMITCIALGKTGRYIASGQRGHNSDVLVWSFEERSILFRLSEHDHGVVFVDFSHDDRLLCSGGGPEDKKILVWDMSNGCIVAIAHQDPASFTVAAWGGMVRDIKRRDTRNYLLATAGNKKIFLWSVDPYAGDMVQERIVCGARGSLVRDITALAFSQDSETLWCTTSTGDFMGVDLRSKQVGAAIPSARLGALSLVCHSRGTAIGGGDGTITLFDKSCKDYAQTELRGGVVAMSLSADQTELVAGTDQGRIYRLRLENLASIVVSENHGGPVTCISYAKGVSDRFATASGDGTVRIWDTADYGVLTTAVVRDAGEPRCLVLTQDTMLTGWRDGQIRSHDADTGRLLWNIDNAHAGGVTSLVLSHNQRFLVSGGTEGELRVWELRSRDLVSHLKQHGQRVTSITLFSDDVHALSVSRDRSLICWDLRSEIQVSHHSQRMGGINAVALSHDETTVLTVGQEKRITFWDLREHHPVLSKDLSKAMDDEGLSLAVSHDGKYFATGGAAAVVKLWRYDDAHLIFEGTGHSGVITGLSFSPDDKQLTSVGEDGNIFIWNVFS